MAWFKKTRKPKAIQERRGGGIPDGLWVRCEGCREVIYAKELDRNARICPKCGYHFRLDVPERIRQILDDGRGRELWSGLEPSDPLQFSDSLPYAERLRNYQKRESVRDAVTVVLGEISSIPVALCVMNYRFMGGSMGSVVGEKIARAAEEAVRRGWPLVVVSASGGARMQEGALSLMQMAKVASALAELREAGLPYLSILTDPTTGGVTASFAMLGDLNIAEPGALIGFTGPRVIQQTIGESLPEGFQTSEFLLEHGFLDLVVPRTELKDTLSRALRHLAR